jgi:hypothetical protein
MLSKSASVESQDIFPLSSGEELPIKQMSKLAGVPQLNLPLHIERYPRNGLLGERPPESGLPAVNDYFRNIPLSTGVLIGCKYLSEGE